MDIKELESLRMFHEMAYKEIDDSAIVVVEKGNVDYENNPTIKDYESKGYKLFDSNRFGSLEGVEGEFLVFVKKK